MAEIVDMVVSLPFWVAVLRIATPLILGTLGVLLCGAATDDTGARPRPR